MLDERQHKKLEIYVSLKKKRIALRSWLSVLHIFIYKFNLNCIEFIKR